MDLYLLVVQSQNYDAEPIGPENGVAIHGPFNEKARREHANKKEVQGNIFALDIHVEDGTAYPTAKPFDFGPAPSGTIAKLYEKGECPDCGEHIPHDLVSGEECTNCGHVFSIDEDLIEAYNDMSLADIRKELRKKETEFQSHGGRGVELADTIDELRLVLEHRKQRRHERQERQDQETVRERAKKKK